MAESFWAIPNIEKLVSPISMLREQASAVGQNTRGLVYGEATAAGSGGDLIIFLRLFVPNLGGYRFEILKYHQPVVSFYPGVMYSAFESKPITVTDGEKFRAVVKMILSSDQVKMTLASLMSQAS